MERAALSLHDRLSYAAARALGGAGRLRWRRYRLIAVPVAAMPAMPRGWEALELGPGAVPEALADPQAQAWRRGQGMACLGVRREGGPLAGLSWLTDRPFEEDEAYLRFVPPPGAAWDTGLFVRPADRATRAFAALWAATRGWCEARGLAWSMSRVADYNLASRSAHARMGAVELGTVAALSLGRLHLCPGARPLRATEGEPRPTVRLPLPA